MLLSVQELETHNKDEHLLLPPRKHKPRLYSSLQHPNLSFHIAWVSLLFVFTEKIPTVYVPCILYTERYKRDKGQRCSGMICSEAYHLLVSSLVLYRGPQIKENHPWTSLSFISPVLNHTVNRREPAWWRTLPPAKHFHFGPCRRTHHKLQGQAHSHTHYIQVFLNIQQAFAHFCAITGTASLNTLQECALGSPASLGATQLKVGRETCPYSLHCS